MFVRTEQRKLVYCAQSVDVHKATVDDALPVKYLFNEGVMVSAENLGVD